MQQDLPGCREQLESLLARNPKHCDARLLMADVLMSTQQPLAALVQVQEALKYHADNPDVQYAMGLTLDLNGRPDEALAYYERASKAMPNNEAYSLSYRTAGEARCAAQRKPPGLPVVVPSRQPGHAAGRTRSLAKPGTADLYDRTGIFGNGCKRSQTGSRTAFAQPKSIE